LEKLQNQSLTEAFVPTADLPIHSNRIPQTTQLGTIFLRNDVLFTNDQGEEKTSILKRNQKTLQKLIPALQAVLLPGETVLYVARAQSPLSLLEQFTAAWWTRLLAAAATVVTNQRLLFFPVKRDGTWRESVRVVSWGDLAEVKAQGFIVKNIVFKSKDGAKTTYTNFRRADAKKIAAIASVILPLASGEMTAAHGFVQLCPGCRHTLTPGLYSCSGCAMAFKDEKTMITRSIFLPGGGYFYTGHPLIAIFPAVVEVFFVLDILVYLIAGSHSPKAAPNVLPTVAILGLFWALETAVTILHCRRYIRDYIPLNPSALRQTLSAKVPN
jgi:hypothetical protein